MTAHSHAARPLTPPTARPAWLGAIGGAVAGGAALLALVGGAVAAGRLFGGGARSLAVPLNAVGALLVRWLQIGQSPAFDGLYADATPLGAVIVVAGGALAGACLGALLGRAPAEPRAAWAMAAAVVGWAVVRWAIAPALDPVLLREVDGRVLAASWFVWGALIGAWLEAMQRLPGPGWGD
ncbi:MAG: hypothetical protein ABI780_11420 [Ardenticatenales bacterium]